MIRPRVLAVVAWRDLRRVLAGRRLGFVGLALALLLPVGAIPISRSAPEAASIVVVSGDIPEALAGRVRLEDGAAVQLSGADPVVVTASHLPNSLRKELATIEEEPRVTVKRFRPELKLPGRNLLIALLAISLLTGPLAESLPGEREQGTLDALLAAAISRGELVGGKWLAWTGAASGMALLGGGAGLLTGAQHPGLWVLGVRRAGWVAGGLGLWRVRFAGDAVGGARAALRVMPVVAVVLLSVSWWLSGTSPVLAAAVPLGGGLLMAGGMVSAPGPVVAALIGTGVATTGLLAGVAHALAHPGSRAPRRGGLLLMGAVAWWLPVLGPEVWQWAGRPEMVDADAGLLAGGLLLLLASAVSLARDTTPPPPEMPTVVGLGMGLGGGLLLAGLQQLVGGLALPGGLAAILLVVVGQELWFRSVMLHTLGGWRSVVVWVVVVSPTAPLQGAAVGLLLCGLSSRYGVFTAMLAALVWRLLG